MARRREAQKYPVNPFIGELMEEVKIGRKRLTLSYGSTIVNKDGEYQGVAEVCQVKKVDKEEFIKIFGSKIKHIFDLTPSALKVCVYIFKVCQDHPSTDRLYLSFFDFEERYDLYGIDKISRPTFFRGFKELIEKRFIAESTHQNLYYINPTLFFNGDRLRFIEEYQKSDEWLNLKIVEGERKDIDNATLETDLEGRKPLGLGIDE